MKLLTLNTHSRPETAAECVMPLAALILAEQLDVIALQEVNQSRNASVAQDTTLSLTGYHSPQGATLPIGTDNFALVLAQELAARGAAYHWCYLPVKRGYDVYDEGLALLWRGEVENMCALQLSTTRDYDNWRRRAALGVQIDQTWFYSLHTSRWDDGEEPFVLQWRRLCESLRGAGRVFLMGDFNCPADRTGEGYDRMIADGWRDTFTSALRTKGYRTAQGVIDGWKDVSHPYPQRIDYIMTNDSHLRVLHARTVFDAERGECAISDHCGVLCEMALCEEGGEDQHGGA
ncbi:MAG: endonuclease/exonuclease/phosphatase family protein [Clostridia bacterium]|nr:endonuclease/exonuclease/phosphatase family protein [Clostridia bacterium]